MKRTVVLAALVAGLGVAVVLAWSAVRQEREFRRLIAQGEAALAQDQTFAAIEAFSGALALRPDSMLAYLKRGDTYKRRGELSAALRDLRQASALDPTATRPLELLGDVNVALGRFERAAEHYRRYVSLDDRAPRVLYKLALAHYRQGLAQRAIKPLRDAVALDERFAEAHHLLGICLRAGSQTGDALRALLKAVQVNPAFTPAREELADLLASMGRTREGMEQLEALAAIEPSRPERLVAVGLAYARMGRNDAAILTLGRAVERYADSAPVYTALGRVWLETAEARNDRVALGKALEALQAAASQTGAGSETLALYGRALFLSGDAEAAERVLQQATARFPVAPAAFLYLSAAAERLARWSVARDALISYVTLNDDNEKSRTLAADIAALSLRIDDAAAAVTWATRALDRESPDAFSLGLLAEAQWRAGRPDAARETLAQALARDPRNRTLLRLRRTITPS